MSIEAMKRIKSLLQDGDKIDSHTISAVVAECDAVILTQQPDTGEPVAQWQKRHPVRTGGRWISTDEHDAKWWSERATGWEARALYTRPAPSGLGDSKRLDYLQDRGATIDLIAGVAAFYPMRFRVGGLHSSANIDVRAAIDAAMLAAK